MIMPGLINLDFADIRTVMSEMGKAMMGTGEAEGANRSIEAAEAAISNPLLDDISMKGAKGVLINITGGPDMTLFEVDEAANRIREEVDPDANIIFGSTFSDDLVGKIRVSVVATGIDSMPNRASDNERAQISAFSQSQEPAPIKKPQAGSSNNTARFIPPKPVEAQAEEAQTNVANFPADRVVTARQQFGTSKKQKKAGFFERAARSFGLKDEEEQRRRPAAPARDRVKVDSEEDYYEIPAYMRRKTGGSE
jgi:cell division protein FtsZ